jgi:hypothetical protein
LAGWYAEGSHADIYRVTFGAKDYIVKIGKTESYSPPFLKSLHLSFSRRRASEFFEHYLGSAFTIIPVESSIRAGLADYRILESYFGDTSEAQAKREGLLVSLADYSHTFTRDLLGVLGPSGVLGVRESVAAHLDVSFLPREQVVIGHPPAKVGADSRRSDGTAPAALTYYIIQDAIMGRSVVPLCRLRESDFALVRPLWESLVTFAVLAKKMYHDTGLLIDTRPDEVVKHPFEWFRQTSNVLVDVARGRAYFVDTRWLWSAGSILGKEGLNLVELLGVRSLNRAIRRYSGLIPGGNPPCG